MDIVEEGISVPEDSSPTVSNIVLGERFPVRIDYSNSRIFYWISPAGSGSAALSLPADLPPGPANGKADVLVSNDCEDQSETTTLPTTFKVRCTRF